MKDLKKKYLKEIVTSLNIDILYLDINLWSNRRENFESLLVGSEESEEDIPSYFPGKKRVSERHF